jgi:hypothetical protein
MWHTHHYNTRPECRKFSTRRQECGIPAYLKTALRDSSICLQILQFLKDIGLYRRVWYSCNTVFVLLVYSFLRPCF